MCHMRRDMALLGRTGGCGMSRVEVARLRLPMDIGVMCDVLTTLETNSQWAELRIIPTETYDGASWIVVTAEADTRD